MPTVNTNDPVELARTLLSKTLGPYFKGPKRKERLENAVNDAVGAILHLITTNPATSKGKHGAAVMTQAASERNASTGKHGVPPRIL